MVFVTPGVILGAVPRKDLLRILNNFNIIRWLEDPYSFNTFVSGIVKNRIYQYA